MLILLIAGAAISFLLWCSGLHFPIWNAQGRLQRHLTDDLGVSLPPGTKVTRAIRVATLDPGEYYAVEIPQASVTPFIAAVRAAGRHPQDRDPSGHWYMDRLPDWWLPQNIPQVQRLELSDREEKGGYTFYYSLSSSTLYVFWFRT